MFYNFVQSWRVVDRKFPEARLHPSTHSHFFLNFSSFLPPLSGHLSLRLLSFDQLFHPLRACLSFPYRIWHVCVHDYPLLNQWIIQYRKAHLTSTTRYNRIFMVSPIHVPSSSHKGSMVSCTPTAPPWKSSSIKHLPSELLVHIFLILGTPTDLMHILTVSLFAIIMFFTRVKLITLLNWFIKMYVEHGLS